MAADRVRLQDGYFEPLLCQQVTGEATCYTCSNYNYISDVVGHVILPITVAQDNLGISINPDNLAIRRISNAIRPAGNTYSSSDGHYVPRAKGSQY